MKITVTILEGQNAGKKLVGAPPFRIGRSAGENELVLEGQRVSRRHCLLRQEGDMLLVENLSRNGIKVSGSPVVGDNATRTLSSGTRLEVGEYTLLVEFNQPEVAQTVRISLPKTTDKMKHLDQVFPDLAGTVSNLAVMAVAKRRGGDATVAVDALARSGPQGGRRFVVMEDVPGALGPRWGGELVLTSEAITLGRGHNADVLLDDARISRIHAKILRQGDKIILEDARSYNGIYHNGARVSEQIELKDKDVLEAKPFRITVAIADGDVMLRMRGLEDAPRPDATLHTSMGIKLPDGAKPLPEAAQGGNLNDTGARPMTVIVMPEDKRTAEDMGRKKVAPKWKPTSDLRHDSILSNLMTITAISTALLIAGWLVLKGTSFLSPGPLSERHQTMVMQGCAQCHVKGAESIDTGCANSNCHPVPGQPAGDTAYPVHRSQPHLTQLATASATSSGLGKVFASLQPGLKKEHLPVTCGTCHVEHQGADNRVRVPPARRCLECHAKAHTTDPQRFAPFPVTDRTKIRCDACHIEHRQPGEPYTLKDKPVDEEIMGLVGRPTSRPGNPVGLAVGAVLGLSLLPAAGYAWFVGHRRRQEQAKARNITIAEMAGRVPGPPKAQLPKINVHTCVGCKACVDACPFDVLELADGISQVSNAEGCHGVAFCAEVCPNGSLTLIESAAPPDVPPVTPEFESKLTQHIYLIGDISGLPLIKNAINQGAIVADKITRMPKKSGVDYDMAIVGAGPAGMSCALTAAELGLKYVLLEQGTVANTIAHFPRQKLVFAQPIELPRIGKLWMGECTKEELLAKWQELLRRAGVKVNENEKVTTIQQRPGGGFQVTTTFKADGSTRSYSAGYIVLAIGKRGEPRKLGVKGEDLSKVTYDLADAQRYQNNKILVVGAGDSALEAALALAAQPGNEVTLSYRGSAIKKAKKRNIEKFKDAMGKGKVRALWSSVPGEVREKEVVMLDANDKNKVLETLPNDFVFVFAGGVAPRPFLEGIGVLPPAPPKNRDA